MDTKINNLIDKAAKKAAEETVRQLKSVGRIKNYYTNSFVKTEKVLYLYPKLPADHPERIKVDNALSAIQDDEYKDIIVERYFNNMQFEEIAEIYDTKYQTISKHRNRLIKILADELFPEDVLDELLEQ